MRMKYGNNLTKMVNFLHNIKNQERENEREREQNDKTDVLIKVSITDKEEEYFSTRKCKKESIYVLFLKCFMKNILWKYIISIRFYDKPNMQSQKMKQIVKVFIA